MPASTRKTINVDFGPEGLPPLPAIHSDHIRLQVFTHRSFFARPTHVFEDLADDPAPDNEILEHQGDSVLTLIVTDLLREMFPHLRVGPSTKIRGLVVGNTTLASISLQYRLPTRLRIHPAQAITLRASKNIQADLFESYIGGLYIDQGLDAVKGWLSRLFRPYITEAYRIVRIQHGLPPSPPATPPLGATSGYSPPPSPTSPTTGHLSLFNQYLAQQNRLIEWVYTDGHVPPGLEGIVTAKTTPIWAVKAIVDGEPFGSGQGRTKKAARNEAAKEGLEKMGVNVQSDP
ncbi:hypothetical protein JAAARDRAFT_27824 [Jaapia argillacea MUCL 33604]|uniref:RNase III domain-containing protein n=1 Tax=Jaapia argillacea MUCL 33604 TaxID=933084 RepID=A0A067QAW1_9AGAM|nr:hypothetical protein JAAARDRAFT_27824 [Jaapia argillacea MUCL 33604]